MRFHGKCFSFVHSQEPNRGGKCESRRTVNSGSNCIFNLNFNKSMKKLLLLIPFAAALVFSGCKYDDDDIWNRVLENEQRLKELEEKVTAANTEISSLKTIVNTLNGHDWITSVTPLSDGTGYVINFNKASSITIKHGTKGADAPVIGVKEVDGVYYWTLGGVVLEDADGNPMQVTGEDGISPKVRINEETEEWEISNDGGETWEPTGVIASGGGSSIFSKVEVLPNSVKFTLADGETTFEIPLYDTMPGLVFTGLNDEDAFVVPIDGEYHTLVVEASANIIRVGIASPNPAPTGWKWKVGTDKIEVAATNVYESLEVLIVGTTPEGTSASYWLTFLPAVTPDMDIQDQIDAVSAGGILYLNEGEYTSATPLNINKEITIKGAYNTIGTVLNAAISATAPLTLESLTVKSSAASVIETTAAAPLIATKVNVESGATGTSVLPVAAIKAGGDVTLTDCSITTKGLGEEEISNAAFSYGISLGAENRTVELNGTMVNGFYYGLYLDGAKGTTVNINDGAFFGSSAIYSKSAECKFFITGATLTGQNLYAAGNDSATIVLADGANGNEMTVTDSRVTNVMTGAALEYLFWLYSNNNKIALKGDTELVDASSTLLYLAEVSGTGNTFTRDETVKLEGKTGVTLEKTN